MKITKQRLEKIIKEELRQQLAETTGGRADRMISIQLDELIKSLTDTGYVFSITRDPSTATKAIKEIARALKEIKTLFDKV